MVKCNKTIACYNIFTEILGIEMKNLIAKLKAFSLAEMLIVLVVVAIIMAVTAPIITKKAKKAPAETGGGDQMPIGSIVIWGGDIDIPAGWLECNGQKLPEGRYKKLKSVMGDSERLPDLSNMFLLGAEESPAQNPSNNQEQGSNKYGPRHGNYMQGGPQMADTDNSSTGIMLQGTGHQPKVIPAIYIIKAEY